MGKKFQLPPEEKHRQVIVDRESLKQVFQAGLDGFADGRLTLDGLKVMRYAHEPEDHISLSYDLRVTDTRTGRSGAQSVFAIVDLDGGARDRYEAARAGARLQPEFGPPLALLPELDMVVWGFPNDPEMPQLGKLLDRDGLESLLREHWQELGPPPTGLARADTRTIKAVALRRCTLRHDLTLQDGSQLVVYSKTFGLPGTAEQLYRTMSAVHAAEVCRSGLLAVPRPLFVVPELEVVFIGDLGGVPIRDDIGELDAEHMGTSIGRALAGLHQCSIEGLPERPADDALRQSVLAKKAIEGFDAAAAERLDVIVDELTGRLEGLTALAPTPIHGAFRIAQLLLADDQLALIDFDGFCLANPVADVGGFVANLHYLAIRGRCTRDEARAFARAFCRGYAAAAPWGLPADVLLWQTVGHLIGKHLKRSVKTGKSEGRMLVDELLELSERLLAGELEL